MKTSHISTIIALVVLGLPAIAHGQGGRAVGIAIDPVDAELDNARALATEAREAYDLKSREILAQVAAGKVPPSQASRLQRLFHLDVLQAELKAAVAYLHVVDARDLQNRAGREEITRAVAETKAALKRAETQRVQLSRDIRERRGPALLVALEFSRLSGTSFPRIEEDARMLQEFDQVLDEIDGSLAEGENALRTLERQLDDIDRSGPLLQARRAIANQRIELIRTKTILVRSGAADIGPLPDLPNFKPLPALVPTTTGSSPPTVDLDDPEVIRQRILREDRR